MNSRKRTVRSKSKPPSLAYEREVREAGYVWVAGTDEVGRGCLAGPVVAAAVLYPPDERLRGVRDSKMLKRVDREKLAERIEDRAVSFGYGQCSPQEIDQMNILRASLEAMRRALANLDPAPDFVLVDGNQKIHPLHCAQRTIVGGDAACHSIALASVLAKVRRDAIMRSLDDEFPGYGFADHKGYATKMHLDAIARSGLQACHRRSFRMGQQSEGQIKLFAET